MSGFVPDPVPSDPTEGARRALLESGAMHDAVKTAEETWDTDALRRDFEVLGFLAPFVVVRRKSDNVKGSLSFTHSPRVYFDFQPESGGK